MIIAKGGNYKILDCHALMFIFCIIIKETKHDISILDIKMIGIFKRAIRLSILLQRRRL